MRYDALVDMLKTYNWDDGFQVPREILADSNCDLALALEIFYLADGYLYLQQADHTTNLKNWEPFLAALYQDILKNRYPKTNTSFSVPLNKVQKYQLRKKLVPEIFLTDL